MNIFAKWKENNAVWFRLYRAALEEKGSAVVILTLAISVLAGAAALVADIGVAYVTQQRLAVAADAAAFAGGQELHLGAARARQAALDNAASNGVNPAEIVVDVEQDNSAVAVRIASPMTIFFARVLGIDEGGELSAQARVVSSVPTALQGVAPLGIKEQPLTIGQEYTLKIGAGSKDEPLGLGSGNFGALALGGPGASTYRNNLKYGYPGLLEVGDVVETQTGNISGPTRKAIKFRLAQPKPPHCSPDSRVRDCPRVLLVPVYVPVESKGNQVKAVRVVGFAAFYVERAPGSGKESRVTGRFVKTFHGGEASAAGSGFGISAARLVE